MSDGDGKKKMRWSTSDTNKMSHHSLSNLLCSEELAALLGDDEPPEDVVALAADVEELMAAMVEEERDYCPGSEYRTRLSSDLLQAREEAIAWILKVNI